MPEILLTSSYLAPVSYYAALLGSSRAYVEQYDSYMKQTYRNRCVIMGAQGRIPLTIPVIKPEGGKALMKDIRISDHGNWRHLHMGALTACYNNTPYFEYYVDDFLGIYDGGYEFLIDFNEALQELVMDLMGLKKEILRTSAYRSVPADGCVDLREKIHPKHGSNAFFHSRPYYQMFSMGRSFEEDLSIVDLLFNMGPESLSYLRDSFSYEHAQD